MNYFKLPQVSNFFLNFICLTLQHQQKCLIMKKILSILVLAGLGVAANAQTAVKKQDILDLNIRVVTCNVRYMKANDGDNSWDFRKERLANTLKSLNADVIGTQEAYDVQKKYLKKQLKGYNVVGVGREDGKKKGEHSAIFYNKKRFKAIECGNFWLSETPDVPSLGWDAACIRIATWAFLEEKATGKRFFFVNTHLDHVGVQARRDGVSLLCKKAKEIGGDCPMVITGDFNAYKESDDIKYVKNIGLTHVYDIADSKTLQPASYHGYKEMSELEKTLPKDIQPQIIDYILINQGTCSYYEIMPPKAADGGFISDHCPVFADITL